MSSSAPKRIKIEKADEEEETTNRKVTKILLIHKQDYREEDTRYKSLNCVLDEADEKLFELYEIHRPYNYKTANAHHAMISYLNWKHGNNKEWEERDPYTGRDYFNDNLPDGELGDVMFQAAEAARDKWLEAHDYIISFDKIEEREEGVVDVLGLYIEYIRERTKSADTLAFLDATFFTPPRNIVK